MLDTVDFGKQEVEEKKPWMKMREISTRSSNDIALFKENPNKKNSEKKHNFYERLNNNPWLSFNNWDTLIKLDKKWWCIPVSYFTKEDKWHTDEEKANNTISAIQEFDPNTPLIREIINQSNEMIDDAINKWIINKNKQDEDYVLFSLYAANTTIHELYPTQNEEANDTVIDYHIENNDWVVTQSAVNRAKSMVCTNWSCIVATVLEERWIGDPHVLFSPSEKHAYNKVAIPGKWIIRNDAWSNSNDILSNKKVQLYKHFNEYMNSN